MKLVILNFLRIFLILCFCASLAWADPDTVDSTDIAAASEYPLPETVSPYTLDEFNQLTDEEKRQIYFNEPQRLPDNFQAEPYQTIMHSQATE